MANNNFPLRRYREDSMSMLVSRDPFARRELHRETVEPEPFETCAWCSGTNARGNLHSYSTQTDGGRSFRQDKRFCSVSCMRTYFS